MIATLDQRSADLADVGKRSWSSDGAVAAPFVPPFPGECFDSRMPNTGNSGEMETMIRDLVSQAASPTADRIGLAAAQAVLGIAGGGVLDSMLGSMGIPNPVAAGSLGKALATLTKETSLEALSKLAEFNGSNSPLDALANTINGCFPQGQEPSADIMNETLGGCFPGNDVDIDEMAQNIGSEALDKAADQLLEQWKVDDESSAAEQIARKAVNDNKAAIKAAAADPSGFISEIKAFFCGAAAGTGMPAVRIADKDDASDFSTMGVATILFEGLPVSRITDMVAGPKAPAPGMPIVQGAANVLSAELPTAFVGAATAVPSTMVSGATSILVGGVIASVTPPNSSAAPESATNSAPASPQSPRSAGSESGSTKSRENSSVESPAGKPDSTAGKPDSTAETTGQGQEGQTAQPAAGPNGNSHETDPNASETTNPSASQDGSTSLANPNSEIPYHAKSDAQNPTRVVSADGVLSKEEHEQRNQYNYVPSTMPTDGSIDQHGIEWKERPLEKTVFHQDGVRQAWESPNRCFEGSHPEISPGTYEACYKPDGTPHPSSTYNYYGSEHTLPHLQCDVAPAVHGNLVYGPHWPADRKPVCPSPETP